MKLFVRAAVVVLALSGSAAYTQMAFHPSNEVVIDQRNHSSMPTCDPDNSSACNPFKR